MNRTERVICGVNFDAPDVEAQLQSIRALGATSVQIYTFWRHFEPEARGRFDWSHYDAQVDKLRQFGLKWVPFLLIGPKYAAPDWWLADPNHRGLVCLEHGETSPIESIWNPAFRPEIERLVGTFAAHYRGWNVIESVQPGICGDYGESIMPVHGNWPGDYHTHRGFWAGDADAERDFRRWAETRYGSIEALNRAWRTGYAGFAEVKPFLPHRTPSRTAWFDFLDWYRQSMTGFAEFWMGCCRRNFPETPIYLCVGGMEEPELACSFSAQAKVCAAYGGGLRLTNESNRYFDNYFLTASAWSACRFYGARLGLEPVGPLTAEGVTNRIFGSADYGNEQIFFYFHNLFARPESGHDDLNDPRAEAYRRDIGLVESHPVKADVAFFWPELVGALGDGIPAGVKPLATYLRRQLPVMPVTDSMIADGALRNFRLLIVPTDAFARRETLLAIAAWVRAGGALLALGALRDIELECVPEYDELFGITPAVERAHGLSQYRPVPHPDFPAFSQSEPFTGEVGYLNLSDDVEILARIFPPDEDTVPDAFAMPRPKPCVGAFLRHPGRGTAIAWFGPQNFERDPQSLFRQPVVLPALLDDVLARYSGTSSDPAAPGEIVRGVFAGGKRYALTEDAVIRPL